MTNDNHIFRAIFKCANLRLKEEFIFDKFPERFSARDLLKYLSTEGQQQFIDEKIKDDVSIINMIEYLAMSAEYSCYGELILDLLKYANNKISFIDLVLGSIVDEKLNQLVKLYYNMDNKYNTLHTIQAFFINYLFGYKAVLYGSTVAYDIANREKKQLIPADIDVSMPRYQINHFISDMEFIFGKNFGVIADDNLYGKSDIKCYKYELIVRDHSIKFDLLPQDLFSNNVKIDFPQFQLCRNHDSMYIKPSLGGKYSLFQLEQDLKNRIIYFHNEKLNLSIPDNVLHAIRLLQRMYNKINVGFTCTSTNYSGKDNVVMMSKRQLTIEFINNTILNKDIVTVISSYLNVFDTTNTCIECGYKFAEQTIFDRHEKDAFPYILRLACCKRFVHVKCLQQYLRRYSAAEKTKCICGKVGNILCV